MCVFQKESDVGYSRLGTLELLDTVLIYPDRWRRHRMWLFTSISDSSEHCFMNEVICIYVTRFTGMCSGPYELRATAIFIFYIVMLWFVSCCVYVCAVNVLQHADFTEAMTVFRIIFYTIWNKFYTQLFYLCSLITWIYFHTTSAHCFQVFQVQCLTAMKYVMSPLLTDSLPSVEIWST